MVDVREPFKMSCRFLVLAVCVGLHVGCGDSEHAQSAFPPEAVDASTKDTSDAGDAKNELGDDAATDARVNDASDDAGDDAATDTGCGDACVEVVDFEATSTTPGTIDVQVQLSANAPCEVSYRPEGGSTWVAREPSEDSTSYGATIPHHQTITGLAPGDYEVRAHDHIGDSYTTEVLRVTTSGGSSCDSGWGWNLPTDVAYGGWTTDHWTQLFPGLDRHYGEADGNVQTLMVDGMSAQVHRLIPTPPGSNGSSRVQGGWDLPARGSYRLAQWIRLPEQFAAGVQEQSGKLGWGLGGGSVPSGGLPDPAGFTVRVTFRGDRTQPDTEAEVSPRLYVYSADQAGTYGDEFPFTLPSGDPILFTRGEWMQIEFEVVVNSHPGAADGQLRAWVNGDPALEVSDKVWFASGQPQVDRLILSTFHGGADSQWAPSTTNEVSFSSVCVRE